MTNSVRDNDKTKLEVVIAGEIVVLSGEESPDYIQRLARYIDKKMTQLGREKKIVSFNSFAKTLLVAINIADDLFKEIDKNEATRLEYAALQTKYGKLSDEFELLTSASRVANQNLEEQLEANERLYKEYGAVKARLADEEETKNEQAADYKALMQDYENALSEVESLQKVNESLLGNNRSLAARLEDLQKSSQILKDEIARSNAEVSSVRRELEQGIDSFAGGDKKQKSVYNFNKK
ncbi:MAG: cell division protein ZapA [Defluviitaleaceae bacterium]|nr:cell division protein ZapA [Defluviitaleaceae bacterium]